MDVKAPIFIVGAPRSGTTLLTQLLSQHEALFVFNETLFYDFCVAHGISHPLPESQRRQLVSHLKSRLEIRTTDDPDALSFGSVLTEDEAVSVNKRFDELLLESKHSSRSQVLNSFMTSILRVRNKTLWGDKTPNHVFHLRRIREDFPQALIINITRNPINFMRSYKFASSRPGIGGHVARLYHPILTALVWKRSTKRFLEFRDQFRDEHMLAIKYEDLIADIPGTGKQLFNRIGLDSDLANFDIRGDNSSFAGNYDQLGPMEIAVGELICCREMAKYGYEKHTGLMLRTIGAIWYTATLPLAVIRAMPVVLKSFRGGLLRYIRAREII